MDELNESLKALSFYLHEKENGERLTTSARARTRVKDMVNMALRETERACDIVHQMNRATAIQNLAEAISVSAPRVHGIASEAAPWLPQHSVLSRLTPRELEVLSVITDGKSNKQGEYSLGISTRTFEVHRARIMVKLGAKNAADLVRMALIDQADASTSAELNDRSSG